MKRLFILTLAVVCLGVKHGSYAEIKNGYDLEIRKAQKRIRNLNEIANGVLRNDERIRLKKWLKAAYATAEKLRESQELTQVLIEKFRLIDPGLYDEINTIEDREGNQTDVYIKVVENLRPGLLGATNVSHSINNPNVYKSEYGDNTVSVRISHVNPTKDLWILVHELGHVRYQVPHLADYTTYYKQVYQGSNIIGHLPTDPSHQSVKATLKTFTKSWKGYKKERKWIAKNKSPKMMASTKKD